MFAKSVKNIVATLLLILFVGYQAGTTLFIHTHNISGHQITHSHPFTSSTHEHSSSQINSISSLSIFHAEYACLDWFSTNPLESLSILFDEISNSISTTSGTSTQLRAPPIC